MNRRRALQILGGAGLLTVGGRFALLPPSRSRTLRSARELAVSFFESLSSQQRARACVDYDHPLRQYHNRGVWGGGLWVNPINLGWEQRRILTDLLYAGLSEAGRGRVPEEYFTRCPGVHSMYVLVCGNPKTPPYQVILTGPHLNLRIGGRSREGAAFGGPLVYGDQRGNEVAGLPGNLYRFQFQTAQRLFETLDPEAKHLALRRTSPNQTVIQLQGRTGSFDGVELSALSPESRTVARELIDGILSTYPEEDSAHAWACLDHNGGLEKLHLSYYQDSSPDGDRRYQNFRLEGPAAVFYFRGSPHVHAFINVAMDPEAPLSVGEVVGASPSVLEGENVKRLFEGAMREQNGTDLAFYDLEAVAGRLRPGPIRTGDIYALESWKDSVALVEIKGADLGPGLLEQLRARGATLDLRRTYSVATTGYAVEESPQILGRIQSRQDAGRVRDVTIAYLRARGLPAAG
jgi:hypothetical protein